MLTCACAFYNTIPAALSAGQQTGHVRALPRRSAQLASPGLVIWTLGIRIFGLSSPCVRLFRPLPHNGSHAYVW